VVRDSVSLVTTLILRAWVVAFGMVVCLRALINEVLVPVKKKKEKKKKYWGFIRCETGLPKGIPHFMASFCKPNVKVCLTRTHVDTRGLIYR
jgi:hypothetical protein